jgi:hypothetical protein
VRGERWEVNAKRREIFIAVGPPGISAAEGFPIAGADR